MKKTLLFLIVILCGITVIYVSTGSGHRNSAPTFDCMACHVGEFVPDMVKIEGLPKTYIPGRAYKVTVTIVSDLESMSESRGGFAIEATAGELIDRDRKHTQLSNGILTHTPEGSELRKWTFSWRAPRERADANIIVMAVAANGDYSAVGDEVGVASQTIKPR